jgi:putative PIN family toxin of toxin-antitoxin system
MRIVVDTNVLLDILVFDDPHTRDLRDAIERRALQCLRSRDTDDELAEVLARPRFALDAAMQRAHLAWWQRRALPIERVFAAPWQCRDPLDQKFLDLAASAPRAHALVTKDKALLALARRARREALAIVRPQGLAAIGGRSPGGVVMTATS